jgi:hypothetical protein
MIEELNLWAAQDALMVALASQPALDRGGAGEVALDLGFPARIEPKHIWLDGGADGRVTNELSGTKPSDEAFTFSVFVYVQAGEDYATIRDTLKALARAVEDALGSATFAAAVPAWSITQYLLDAGTDGTNRQLALELKVECRCW